MALSLVPGLGWLCGPCVVGGLHKQVQDDRYLFLLLAVSDASQTHLFTFAASLVKEMQDMQCGKRRVFIVGMATSCLIFTVRL